MNAIKSMIFSPRKDPKDSPTVRLMKTLRFSGKDLDMNRDGVLSDRQKRRLHRGYFWRFSLCALWAIGIAIPFLTLPLTISLDRLLSNPVTYVIIGIGGAITLGFTAAYRRHRKNVEIGQVVAFTGRVKKFPLLSKASMIVMNESDRTERVYSRNGFWQERAFTEGELYTFYAPVFDQSLFVSVEHVPAEHHNFE